jgi:DHA1 family multidrug resistance protein-like MFS transporter
MADMFSLQQLPYVLGIWSVFAIAGPIVGPIAGSYAAQAKGWRWPMYEVLWMGGFALIFLALFLPETYEPTILLKRARRLRKLTGNHNLHTAAEKAQESQTAGQIMYEAVVRPFILMVEPVLMFANLYLGFVCQLSVLLSSLWWLNCNVQTPYSTCGSSRSRSSLRLSTTSVSPTAACLS